MNILYVRIYTVVLGIAMAVMLTIGIDGWLPRLVAVLVLITSATILGMSVEDAEIWTEDERAARLGKKH